MTGALAALRDQLKDRAKEIDVMANECVGIDLGAYWQGARDELEKWVPRLDALLRVPQSSADLREAAAAALEYLEGTLGPCDSDCECVIHPLKVALQRGEAEAALADLRQRVARQAVTIHDKREAWARELELRKVAEATLEALRGERDTLLQQMRAYTATPKGFLASQVAAQIDAWADRLATLTPPPALKEPR